MIYKTSVRVVGEGTVLEKEKMNEGWVDFLIKDFASRVKANWVLDKAKQFLLDPYDGFEK